MEGKLELKLSELRACFPATYQESRQRLLETAQEAGLRHVSHPHPECGPDGRPLSVDAVWCGAARAASNRLLIISSGLHGVEGPFGAACQLAALRHGGLHQCAQEAGVSVLLLHALNPFGFAHHRRWDEQNIDVNRNFWSDDDNLDDASPVYQDLARFLHPRRLAWHDRWSFYGKALSIIARHGFSRVKQGIAQGQFADAQGLFFGGRRHSWTRQLLAEQLPTWIAGFDEATQLDVHTGLGPWGRRQLLIDYPLQPPHHQMMERYPSDAWQAATADGVAYHALGVMGGWCVRHCSRYLYLCVELGTYSPLRVLAALRRENQQWHDEQDRSPRVVEELRECFCPRSDRWRRSAVDAVWGAIVRSLGPP